MLKTWIHLMILAFALILAQVQSQETTAAAPTTPAKEIFEAVFYSKEPGRENEEECKIHFIRYDSAYLRGVKAPNHLHFNGSSFNDCKRRCCYESSFVCKSFSYFRPLRQCFIMNVTRDFENVEMVDFRGYIHVQIVEAPVEETTQPPIETTTGIDVTTEPEFREPTTFIARSTDTTSQGSTIDTQANERFVVIERAVVTSNYDVTYETTVWSETEGSGLVTDDSTKNTVTVENQGPDKAVLEEAESPEKLVGNNCPMTCENDGKCMIRESNDGIAAREAYCECTEGFEGEKCENTVTESEGFPVWIIIVIVLGGLIVLLLLVVCILYQVYRRKKGEYRVVRQIQRWARRGKKKQKVSEEKDATDLEASQNATPTTSVQSIQNSHVSSTTKSSV